MPGPLIAHAARRRLPTRVGLEDTAVGPDGGLADSNAELILLAPEMWAASGPR